MNPFHVHVKSQAVSNDSLVASLVGPSVVNGKGRKEDLSAPDLQSAANPGLPKQGNGASRPAWQRSHRSSQTPISNGTTCPIGRLWCGSGTGNRWDSFQQWKTDGRIRKG